MAKCYSLGIIVAPRETIWVWTRPFETIKKAFFQVVFWEFLRGSFVLWDEAVLDVLLIFRVGWVTSSRAIGAIGRIRTRREALEMRLFLIVLLGCSSRSRCHSGCFFLKTTSPTPMDALFRLKVGFCASQVTRESLVLVINRHFLPIGGLFCSGFVAVDFPLGVRHGFPVLAGQSHHFSACELLVVLLYHLHVLFIKNQKGSIWFFGQIRVSEQVSFAFAWWFFPVWVGLFERPNLVSYFPITSLVVKTRNTAETGENAAQFGKAFGKNWNDFQSLKRKQSSPMPGSPKKWIYCFFVHCGFFLLILFFVGLDGLENKTKGLFQKSEEDFKKRDSWKWQRNSKN